MTEESDNIQTAKGPSGIIKLAIAYAAGYILLLGAYVVYIFTGSTTITPKEYLEKAFPNTNIASDNLKEVITEKAHIRMWNSKTPPFDDNRGVRYHLPENVRLNDAQAVALAQAIIKDNQKPEEDRIFHTLSVYDDDGNAENAFFINLPWYAIMNLYNLAGLYVFLYCVLSGPLGGYLSSTARETREALANANKMKEEANDLKKKYEEMLSEVEAEKQRLSQNEKEEFEEEREHILKMATHEAETALENLKKSVEAEMTSAAEGLRSKIASQAITKAREIIALKAADKEHSDAVSQFVEDLKKADLA